MYTDNNLFLYRPLFVLQILVAELLFCGKLKRRKLFWLYFPISFVLVLALSFSVPYEYQNSAYGSFLFFLLFLFCVGFLFINFAASSKTMFFVASAGYTVQHIASELYELLYAVMGLNNVSSSNIYGEIIANSGTSSSLVLSFFGNNWFLAVLYGTIYFLVYLFMYYLLARKVTGEDTERLSSFSLLTIFFFSILVNVVFGAIVIWSVNNSASKTVLTMLHVYNIACCSLLLFLMFELKRRRVAETELAIENELHIREREKYEQAKKNREIINLKCHDLKHQIHSIGKTRAIGKDVLNEIEESINIYDTIYDTGCEALDIILGEKDLICRKENITFTPIVDGSLFNSFKESEVYSLFGNILDNAIEASRKVNMGARVIGLSIKKVNGFTIVHEYNRYKGKLQKTNGSFLSTKGDDSFHGYGLKSITAIVEKYGGQLSIKTKDQIFTMDIMFESKH